MEIKNQNPSPYFSIIIPVYNTFKDYLDKCIESITDQTYSNFEIILVDDGSNRDTSDLCDMYSTKDERIRVIHQINQGVSSARNNGIKNALGKWILFVDADDWIDINTCEYLHSVIQNANCDILLFKAIDEYSEKQLDISYGLKDGKTYDMKRLDDKEFLYRRAMGVPNVAKGWSYVLTYSWDKAYRLDFLTNNNIQFPVGIPKSEDKVFVLECFQKMSAMLYSEKVLYHYRRNDLSICNIYSENADVYRLKLLNRLNEIAKSMDTEIGKMKSNPEYNEISHELKRFTFGVIADVLLLQYFHKDNPAGFFARRRAAVHFISQDLFASSITELKYSELSNEVKLKKFLLSHKLVGTFCFIKKSLDKAKGKRVENS